MELVFSCHGCQIDASIGVCLLLDPLIGIVRIILWSLVVIFWHMLVVGIYGERSLLIRFLIQLLGQALLGGLASRLCLALQLRTSPRIRSLSLGVAILMAVATSPWRPIIAPLGNACSLSHSCVRSLRVSWHLVEQGSRSLIPSTASDCPVWSFGSFTPSSGCLLGLWK